MRTKAPLPSRRWSGMSAVPPPRMKRDPLAKSAPCTVRAFDEGRDLARVGGAVRIEHHDDVSRGPRRSRSGGQRPCRGPPAARSGWRAAARVATATVSSVECPSTRRTSKTSSGIRGRTWGRLRASLSAGTMTLIVGLDAIRELPECIWARNQRLDDGWMTGCVTRCSRRVADLVHARLGSRCAGRAATRRRTGRIETMLFCHAGNLVCQEPERPRRPDFLRWRGGPWVPRR